MTNSKSYLVDYAHNGGTSLGELGQLHAGALEHRITLAEVEREAALLRHGFNWEWGLKDFFFSLGRATGLGLFCPTSRLA